MANLGLVADATSPYPQVPPIVAANHASAPTTYTFGDGTTRCWWRFVAPGSGVVTFDTYASTTMSGAIDPNIPKERPFASITHFVSGIDLVTESLDPYSSKIKVTVPAAGEFYIATMGVPDLNDGTTYASPMKVVLNAVSTDFIQDDVGSDGGGGTTDPDDHGTPKTINETHFPDIGKMTHPFPTSGTYDGWCVSLMPYGTVYYPDGEHPEYWADQPPYGTYPDSGGTPRDIARSYAAAIPWEDEGCWMEAKWFQRNSPVLGYGLKEGFVRFEGRITNFYRFPGGGADPVYADFLTLTASIKDTVIWQGTYDPLVGYTLIAETVVLTPAQAKALTDGTVAPLRWDVTGPTNDMTGQLQLDLVALNITWEEGLVDEPDPAILGDQRGRRRVFS